MHCTMANHTSLLHITAINITHIRSLNNKTNTQVRYLSSLPPPQAQPFFTPRLKKITSSQTLLLHEVNRYNPVYTQFPK